MIGPIVYVLCALTSGLCAVLLLRAYRRNRTRLLFWCGAAFCAFGVSNTMLFVDLVLLPHTNLSLARHLVTLGGIGLMLRGPIWERSTR